MTEIKTPADLSEITAVASGDLICVWDIDEAADEKLKRITRANFFNNNSLTGTTTIASMQTAADLVFTAAAALLRDATDSYLRIGGGNAYTDGGCITLTGSTKSGDPNTIQLRINDSLKLNIGATASEFSHVVDVNSAVRIGNSTGSHIEDIGNVSGNLHINARNSLGGGSIYLNYSGGDGGVNFCDGANSVVGSVDETGAASFDASLQVGTTGTFGGNVQAGANNDFVLLAAAGSVEICDSAGSPFVDFKTASGEDYDTRIIQASNGLTFYTGGNGSTALGMTIDSSRNVTIANGELSASVSARFAEKIVIPLNQPSSLENGCIWIA